MADLSDSIARIGRALDRLEPGIARLRGEASGREEIEARYQALRGKTQEALDRLEQVIESVRAG